MTEQPTSHEVAYQNLMTQPELQQRFLELIKAEFLLNAAESRATDQTGIDDISVPVHEQTELSYATFLKAVPQVLANPNAQPLVTALYEVQQ